MSKYTLFGSDSLWTNYIINDDNLEKLVEEAKNRLNNGHTASIQNNETLEIINLETV